VGEYRIYPLDFFLRLWYNYGEIMQTNARITAKHLYFGDCSYKEIGEVIGVAGSTVAKWATEDGWAGAKEQYEQLVEERLLELEVVDVAARVSAHAKEARQLRLTLFHQIRSRLGDDVLAVTDKELLKLYIDIVKLERDIIGVEKVDPSKIPDTDFGILTRTVDPEASSQPPEALPAPLEEGDTQ
jgi:hypothetical protein